MAITVCELGNMKIVQLSGMVVLEYDPRVSNEIFHQIVKPKLYRGRTSLLLVTLLQDKANHVVIRVIITNTICRLGIKAVY